MHYQISRNGQTYGPYTLEDLQRYVTSGNVLLTDLAKSDDPLQSDWLPVSQILGASTPPTPVPTDTATPFAPVTYTAPRPTPSLTPSPVPSPPARTRTRQTSTGASISSSPSSPAPSSPRS